MKKKMKDFSVKSRQTLGRFGNNSYFCRCQSVTDRLGNQSVKHSGGL